MRSMRWDDLRYVLAVAQARTLMGAAKALRVNRTTVLRRINAFERANSVRIFERTPAGYELTEAGEELIAAARNLENTVAMLERKLTGHDLRPEGVVHLTTTDTLLNSVLAAPLAVFQRANRGIVLEVTTSNSLLNLTKRDADVAIRPVADVPQDLIGRRICNVAFAIYDSVARAADREKGTTELSHQSWVAPDDTLAGTSVARWVNSSLPEASIVARLDSLLAVRELCAAGTGLAALPCYLGDQDERLVRVRPPVPEMTTALWVLTHPDLMRTARVRLFVEFTVSALRTQRMLFEGQRPRL